MNSRNDDIPPAPSAPRRERVVVALVLAAAAVVRFLYLWQSADNPTFAEPIVDSATYHSLAIGWSQHGEFSERFLWQPLFYPAFLSAVYALVGPSILTVKILQMLLGCATCALTYRLGRRLFGQAAGILAAAVVVLNGPLVFFEGELLATGWAAFWSVALVLLLVQVAAGSSKRTAVGLGAVAALSILTRTNYLLFIVIGLGWLALRIKTRRGRWIAAWRRVALVLGGMLAILGPVAIVNSMNFGHAGIIPAAGGLNLYIGNNPDFEKTVTLRPGYEWRKLTRMVADSDEAVDGVRRDDQWRDSRAFAAMVRQYAFSEPLSYLRGLGQKCLHLIGSREIPRNVDVYLFRTWSPILSALTWKWGGFGFPYGLILPLALLGLATSWRRTPIPLKLLLLLYSASIVLVFVSARYRVTMIPLLAVLGGAGALKLVELARRRRWRALATFAAGGLTVVACATFPGPFAQERIDSAAEMHHGVGYNLTLHERWPEAVVHFRRAVARDPELMEAHHYLGVCLVMQDSLAAATESFETAARLDPTFTVAQHRLEQVRGPAASELFDRAVAQNRRQNFDQATSLLQRCLELTPEYAPAHLELARACDARGQKARAVHHCREAVRAKSDWPPALSRLAWMLATCRVDSLRNGQDAVALAQRACDLTENDDPWLLGTLAAALAEAGRFDAAVAAVNKAIDIAGTAGQSDLLPHLRREMEFYRSRKPYRE